LPAAVICPVKKRPKKLDDGAIPSDVRHARESVHLLGSADSGDLVDREHGRLPAREQRDQLGVLLGPNEGDERGSLSEHLRLVRDLRPLRGVLGERLRGPHLQKNVRRLPHGPRDRLDRRARLDVVLVAKRGQLARPGLDDHLEAELDQPLRGLRRRRDPALPEADLSNDPYLHRRRA
jgi:hypothetical protein